MTACERGGAAGLAPRARASTACRPSTTARTSLGGRAQRSDAQAGVLAALAPAAADQRARPGTAARRARPAAPRCSARPAPAPTPSNHSGQGAAGGGVEAPGGARGEVAVRPLGRARRRQRRPTRPSSAQPAESRPWSASVPANSSAAEADRHAADRGVGRRASALARGAAGRSGPCSTAIATIQTGLSRNAKSCRRSRCPRSAVGEAARPGAPGGRAGCPAAAAESEALADVEEEVHRAVPWRRMTIDDRTRAGPRPSPRGPRARPGALRRAVRRPHARHEVLGDARPDGDHRAPRGHLAGRRPARHVDVPARVAGRAALAHRRRRLGRARCSTRRPRGSAAVARLHRARSWPPRARASTRRTSWSPPAASRSSTWSARRSSTRAT